MTTTISSIQTNLPSYPERLHEIGILLLEPFTFAKSKHLMQCIACNHKWNGTPISRLQSNKRDGGNGCPVCGEIKRTAACKVIVLQKIKERNLVVLTPGYNGHQDSQSLIHVHNTKCGHDFKMSPNNILREGFECSICGKNKQVEDMRERHLKTRIGV